MKRTEKSLKINMVLNAIRGVLSVLFPLITFPYISKILGVENVGQYNFANSIISYFVLIAGLGITNYAIREGARIREDKIEFSRFANQMLSINVFATFISYGLLFIAIFSIPKLALYKVLLIILSLQIIFKTIGVEWLYSVYEDYLYITIRSIFFQILSLLLLFVFVKNENDVDIYAIITVISIAGSNIFNLIHSRRYTRLKLTCHCDIKSHIKPIMVLFAMAVTTTLYVSSDTTILGFLCDDYTVGVYAVSTKVYNVVKTILSSVLVVSIPRLSALLGTENKNEFNVVASDVYKTLLLVAIPSIVGIILLREQVVMILASQDYIKATSSLAITSVALLFSLGAWFWGNTILIPLKKEKIVFYATVVSAVTNIGLNIVFIPIFKENAAAFTTVLAEFISFIWCRQYAHKHVSLGGIKTFLIKIGVGCAGIIAVCLGLMCLLHNYIIYTIMAVVFSVITYLGIEIAVKNEVINSSIIAIKHKLKK